MTHDPSCELKRTAYFPMCQFEGCRVYIPAAQRHCHCAARLHPLCETCSRGMHVNHREASMLTGKACECDLEAA